MSNLIRFLITIILLVLGGICLLIFASGYYYNLSLDADEETQKLKLLEQASSLKWPNDSVYAEKGKIYFTLAMEKLSRGQEAVDWLERSADNLKQALSLNPFDHRVHLYYAQTLQYLDNYIGNEESEKNILDEYKKAAVLSGYNQDVLFEVGKALMTRWPTLSQDDKNYTVEILQQILQMGAAGWLDELLDIWELNSRDYEVMYRIIPENSVLLRLYGKFLGERSLSLEERRKVMARAEYLDFIRAKEEYRIGESNLQFSQIEDALKHLQLSRNMLHNIQFYQDFTGDKLIDHEEYRSLWYVSGLYLAKAKIEDGAELKDVEQDILDYVEFETSMQQLDVLISYLQDKNIIDRSPEQGFSDLDKTAFHLKLLFSQNRYRDIIRIGKSLQESLIVPEEKKSAFIDILLLVADSYRKTDYVYNALEIYQKALDLDDSNLETLERLHQNYLWLNREEDAGKVEQKIESLLTDKKIDLSFKIAKGKELDRRLLLVARPVEFTLTFNWTQNSNPPLVTILFNGRLKWEDYLNSPVVKVLCDANMGVNYLTISPVNSDIVIESVEWKNLEEGS